jgi:hypothetical protein
MMSFLLVIHRTKVRFLDAYARGLNGRQTAWATRKYRGHRALPMTILEELDKNGIT